MAKQTLNELLLDEIKDIYDAEHQLTQALPKMMQAVLSSELKSAFQIHLQQTEEHIMRLEQVFEMMGETAERKTCKAMKGLLAEGTDLMSDHPASIVRDAALVGSAQRVEHYEIAAYGTSRAYAEALGENDIAELLQITLDEEKETDDLLTDIGMDINAQSAEGATGTSSRGNQRNRTMNSN